MSNIDKLKSAAAKAVDNFDPNMFVETRDILALLNEMESAWAHGFNQCRAATLQGSEPSTDNTNQQFESLSRGGK